MILTFWQKKKNRQDILQPVLTHIIRTREIRALKTFSFFFKEKIRKSKRKKRKERKKERKKKKKEKEKGKKNEKICKKIGRENKS